MNSPQGFTLDSSGKIVDVDPMGVIFNDAMPLMAAHMVVAAYVVGGFLIASVYAVGMLRGRRDRYHRLGFIIPFTVAAIAIPIQMGVGDSLARWVYNNQPVKFAAIEMVPEDRAATCPRRCSATSTPTARSPAASRSPGSRRGCRTPAPARTPSSRASTRARPRAADHPRGQHRPPRLGRHGRARAPCCSC